MNTDEEEKQKNPVSRATWIRRLMAGFLAVVMLASLIYVGSSGSPLMNTEAKNAPASSTSASNSEVSALPSQNGADSQNAAQNKSQYAVYLDQANDAVSAKDYAQALSLLQKCEALAEDSNQLAMLIIQEGNIYFNQGNYSGAKNEYYRVLKLDQTKYSAPEIYYMSAKCSLLLNDPKDAVDECGLGLAGVKDSGGYSAELYVMRGTAYVYLGQYALASGDYSAAIKAGYSDTKTLYEQISLCSYLAGNYGQTVSAGEMMKTGGGSGDYNSWTSLSYYALGMYDKAAEAYEALLNSDQSFYTKAQIYSCIAKCRILLNQYDEAIEKCDNGLQTQDQGEAGTLYALRGTAYMAKTDYADAVNDFSAAIQNGYEDPATMNTQCAACSYYMGNLDNAVKYGMAALDGAAADTEAVLWAALSYYELGQYKEAAPLLKRSLNISQNYCAESEILRCLSRCDLTQGNFKAASDEATEGIGKSSGTPSSDFYAIRGAAYQAQGLYQKALADFYAAIALGYTDTYEMYRQCTLCNFLLGNYDQAVSCGERAAENGGENDGTLYYWIGISCFSQQKYDDGKKALMRAAEIDDKQENLYFYLGVCCFSLEQYDSAADYFTRSAARGETAERSIYNRALCMLQLGKYSDAKTDLETSAAQTSDKEIAGDAQKLLDSLKSILS